MTLLEVRERLRLQRAADVADAEAARRLLRAERALRGEELAAKAARASQTRAAVAAARREGREAELERRAIEAAEEQRLHEEAVEAAHARRSQRAEARAAQREATEAEEGRRKRRAQFLGAAAAQVEERRLQDLVRNAEAAAVHTAADLRVAAEVTAAVHRRDAGDRAHVRALDAAEAVRRDRSQREAHEQRRAEAAAGALADAARGKERVFTETAREERLHAAVRQLNVYATALTQRSVRSARMSRTGRTALGDADPERQRDAKIQGRLARASDDQARRTGLLATQAQRALREAETGHRLHGTVRAMLSESRRMATGLAASRRKAIPRSSADSSATTVGATSASKRTWELGGGHVGDAAHVLLATSNDAAAWESVA
jgi:hypothetical protein